MTTDEYLDLITSEHREKPNFVATVTLNVEVQARVQALLSTMISKFDVDVAVGDQLDTIGLWVGISRRISVPIPGVYFSWDGTDPFVGWDYGIWQSSLDPTEITILPDDVYRTFIKAKIAANRWSGTTTDAYTIWSDLFPNLTILIQDYQDMTYALAFVGGILDSLTLAILTEGLLPLKPEGVRVSTYFIPIDDGPIFGWDLETDFVRGWDDGSWAREVDPI